jgi:hypothetical protein
MPDQDAVLAITAGVADMQAVLDLIWQNLLPAMVKNSLPDSEGDQASLNSLLNNLVIDPPQTEVTSSTAQLCTGKRFYFEPNYETLRSLCFDFKSEECVMTYQLLGGGKRRGIHQLTVGYGKWSEGESYLGGLIPQKVAVSGAWPASDTFTLTMCQYETPFILTLSCRFEGNRVYYDCKVNVAFGPVAQPQLIGISED